MLALAGRCYALMHADTGFYIHFLNSNEYICTYVCSVFMCTLASVLTAESMIHHAIVEWDSNNAADYKQVHKLTYVLTCFILCYAHVCNTTTVTTNHIYRWT
jgi:hypothetical protein